mmetsp:Transcript_5731/g.19501  ORF Transcript_5731/g.19501 Transcript_5731/m.19501 type:complete len:269 (-) Transcript_5731:561-1367(-)
MAEGGQLVTDCEQAHTSTGSDGLLRIHVRVPGNERIQRRVRDLPAEFRGGGAERHQAPGIEREEVGVVGVAGGVEVHGVIQGALAVTDHGKHAQEPVVDGWVICTDQQPTAAKDVCIHAIETRDGGQQTDVRLGELRAAHKLIARRKVRIQALQGFVQGRLGPAVCLLRRAEPALVHAVVHVLVDPAVRLDDVRTERLWEEIHALAAGPSAGLTAGPAAQGRRDEVEHAHDVTTLVGDDGPALLVDHQGRGAPAGVRATRRAPVVHLA